MPSYQYRKCHCGDKTVVRLSYLHNGISYTGKMAYFYWISPLLCNIVLARMQLSRETVGKVLPRIFQVEWKKSTWKDSYNALKLGLNGHQFADNTFQCIFFYETVWILIKNFTEISSYSQHWFKQWFGAKQATSHVYAPPSLNMINLWWTVLLKWYFKRLTHWGRDKMVANILTFSNAFSWMEMYEFLLRFHEVSS